MLRARLRTMCAGARQPHVAVMTHAGPDDGASEVGGGGGGGSVQKASPSCCSFSAFEGRVSVFASAASAASRTRGDGRTAGRVNWTARLVNAVGCDGQGGRGRAVSSGPAPQRQGTCSGQQTASFAVTTEGSDGDLERGREGANGGGAHRDVTRKGALLEACVTGYCVGVCAVFGTEKCIRREEREPGQYRDNQQHVNPISLCSVRTKIAQAPPQAPARVWVSGTGKRGHTCRGIR